MKDLMLKLEQVCMSFGGQSVLRDISLDIFAGETCCILGENGAGKSTLGKLMAGIIPASSGSILLKQQSSQNLTPSRKMGCAVGMSFQDNILFKNLTVMQNILISPSRSHPQTFWVDEQENLTAAKEALSIFPGSYIDPHKLVSELSLPECKLVELAKLFYQNPSIVVLDEPTSCLGKNQAEELFEVLRQRKNAGTAIVYITHNIEEIYAIGDRVVVLSGGETISDHSVCLETEKDHLVHDMVGEHYFNHYPRTPNPIGEVILSAKAITNERRTVDNVSFELHSGEILGIAGLQGAGKSSILKMLFGLEPMVRGSIEISEKSFYKIVPHQAIAGGLSYLSDDIDDNIFPHFSCSENIMVTSYHKFIRQCTISWTKLNLAAREAMHYFKIKGADHQGGIGTLSAGNLQKSVICRWAINESRIFLLDEPTKQLDIPSKIEVYNILNKMAHNNSGIILVSSDIEELLGMCDRILVINRGCLIKELDPKNTCCEDVLTYSFDSNVG